MPCLLSLLANLLLHGEASNPGDRQGSPSAAGVIPERLAALIQGSNLGEYGG